MKNKKLISLFVTSLLTLNLVGCSSTGNEGKSEQGGTTKAAENTLYTNGGPEEFFEAPWLNPGTFVYNKVLYDRLIFADENLDPISGEGQLAKSYEMSEDGLNLKFTLRENVFWHDGEPITPQDIKWSIEYSLKTTVINNVFANTFKAIEGAEDDKELGKQDIIDRGVTSKDVICGIAASGRTPYVIGAMEYAKELGCAVLSITMNPNSEMSKKADLPINIIVGAEVIMGSTRMKSGTAQKMVCNMLTTASMVKMGKVYSNLMVDVKTSNEKLVERAKRIIMIATNVKYDVAEKFLEEADNSVKLAIFMIKSGLDKDSAKSILDRQEGYISEALKSIEKL